MQLFAIAFGDMPGVEVPPGPAGRIRSATIALRAVRGIVRAIAQGHDHSYFVQHSFDVFAD